MRGFILLAASVLLTGGEVYSQQKLLKAISMVESGHKDNAVGSRGEQGRYQLSRVAWAHISSLRARKGVKVWSYSAANKMAPASIYAQDYLAIQAGQFKKATGRNPSPQEAYAMWNLGFAGFKRRGFKLSRCPSITRRAAARVATEVLND